MIPYKYCTLNSEQNEIRVLRILPDGGDKELYCEMVHVQLDQALDYQALSYAWRDPQLFPNNGELQKLNINDSPCLVEANLASFLRHIRLEEGPTDWFWVDALCINQHDIAERNLQLLRMSEIFRMAKRVVVWLGPEMHNSDKALSFVKRHFDLVLSPPQLSMAEFAWWRESDLMILNSAIRTKAAVPGWKAIYKLFERAWWRRTWVVQEAVLSKELIFMCGHETVSWLDLWYLLENIWAHSHWTRQTIPEGAQLLITSSPARTVLWLRATRDQNPRDLLQALYHLRPTQTSDPRDKVYGLLGMAHDSRYIVPSPNYSSTLMEVGISLLDMMTSVREDLDWLTLAGDHENTILPSWYPDLTKTSAVSSINTSRSIPNGRYSGFRAAGNSQPRVDFNIATLTCTAMGFVVDTVDGLAAGRDGSNAELVQPQSQHMAYGSDAKTYEAIWKTLVADQDFEGTTSAWRAPPLFDFLYAMKALDVLDQLEDMGEGDICFNELGKWFMKSRSLVFAGKTLEDWTRAAAAKSADAEFAEKDSFGFERRLYSTISGRRLLVTQQGYLGIANESVRQGDLICIFLGGRMPVIVRPSGENAYHFICESYVHGLMDGEAMNSTQADPGIIKQFILA